MRIARVVVAVGSVLCLTWWSAPAAFARSSSLTSCSAGTPSGNSGLRPIDHAAFEQQIVAGENTDLRDVEVVCGDVDLSHAGTVLSAVRCVDCWFDASIVARDTTFAEPVVLSGSVVSGGLDFRGAEFKRGFFLRPVAQRAAGQPRPGLVVGHSLFAASTFDADANFDAVTFQGAVNFDHVRFLGVASFARADFRAAVQFYSAHFSDNAVFSGSGGGTSCDVGSFHKAASFQAATFAALADFHHRCFLEGGIFTGVHAADIADFSDAVFVGPAMLNGASLGSTTSFLRAVFKGKRGATIDTSGWALNLRGARTPGSILLENATVSGTADLDDLSVGGTLDLRFTERPIDLRVCNMSVGQVAVPSQDFDKGAPYGVSCDPELTKAFLAQVETSARSDGDIALANEAHYRLLAMDEADKSSFPRLWDRIVYRGICGYLVKPLRPLGALVVILAADRGEDHLDMVGTEDLVEGASELRVPITDQEPDR
jgi:hypothetical protein